MGARRRCIGVEATGAPAAGVWTDLARAKAERKLREKAEKGLAALEKERLKMAREMDRLQRRERRRERDAERRERHRRRRLEREERDAERRAGRQPRADATGAPPPRTRRRASLTPEERAYREARRRANAKIGFLTHGIAYLSVLALILVSSRSIRVTLIVATAWGIGLAIHYFSAVVAPGLRRRLIEDEVGRNVARSVTQARRAVASRHERSLEDLSASIAHEIRNPVTAAKSLVQQMGEDPVSNRNIEYANVALEELDRVERSISHLLRYARDEELHFESFDMSQVMSSVVESFRDRIDLLGVELELQLDSPGRMRGDPERMRRVLVNVVGNALDAIEQGDSPVPRLQLAVGENLAGTEVWVRVRDNGPGIHPDVIDKIFNPFFTTKDQGTGLGLALSKKIVAAHGGTIEVDSDESGSEFVLTFPKDAGATS